VQERHKQSAAFRPAPSVYGGAQLPQQHVGAPFMTPGAETAQAVRRIPRGTGWLTAVVSDETGRQTGNLKRLIEILK